MGLDFKLIGFPLLIMFISFTINGNTVIGQTSQALFCNTNGGFATCSSSSTANGTSSLTISCPASAGGGHCFITSPCPTPSLPSPAFCYGPANAEYLPAGSSITIPGNQVQSSISNGNQVYFLFNSVSVEGFIPWIVISVGVAVLAGLNIFGSGESTEAVHILFTVGPLVALWILFSTVEGFLAGSPNSFFVQMDQASTGFIAIPIGTSLWIVLSLVYLLGVVKTVSRGGGTS